MKQHVRALAGYLGADKSTVTQSAHAFYGLPVYSVNGAEYALATDIEAHAALVAYVSENAHTFTPEFIGHCTGEPDSAIAPMLARGKGGNRELFRLIEATCGLSEFATLAACWDSYAHFLAPYDGVEVMRGDLHIFRLS